MPVYYTTTKLSGKRKSSVKNQRLNADHEKWLRSMGIDKPWKPKSEPLKISANRDERYRSVGDGIGNGFVKTTSAISGDYIVGQAYNKGKTYSEPVTFNFIFSFQWTRLLRPLYLVQLDYLCCMLDL